MAAGKAVRIRIRHPRLIPVDADIQVRVLESRDARALFDLVDRNREHLGRWMPWVETTRTARDTRAFIDRGREQLRRDDGFQAGIWYCGQLVGAIGFHYWNWDSRRTEIGYWLTAEAQGKGIMTRACRTMVDYALGNLKLNRVEIRTAVSNARSRALAGRLGFVQEGVLRGAEWTKDGFEDQVVYGLLRDEWAKHRAEAQQSL